MKERKEREWKNEWMFEDWTTSWPFKWRRPKSPQWIVRCVKAKQKDKCDDDYRSVWNTWLSTSYLGKAKALHLASIGWDKLHNKTRLLHDWAKAKARKNWQTLAQIKKGKSSKGKLNGDKWRSSTGTQMKRQMQLSLRAFSETICHSTAAAIVNWQLAIATAKVSQSVSDAKSQRNDRSIKLSDSFCLLAKNDLLDPKRSKRERSS